jgi:hypothetical protein
LGNAKKWGPTKTFWCLIRFTEISCMFALLLCKLCLQECSLKNKFVGQLNLVFLWAGHLLCYKPFLKIKYLGTSYIFKMFYVQKNRS